MAGHGEIYTVVVHEIPARELLFALAREAKLDIDIHSGIEGSVTLNAIDQTLPQLLARIARQIDMRWELDQTGLSIMPDTPHLKIYKADYVNISRETSASVTVTTQVTAVGGVSAGTNPGALGGNNSTTRVDNKAHNRFWETLEANLKDLLRETDKILPDGSSETIVEHADRQATSGTGTPATGRTVANHTAGIAASANPATLQQSGTVVVKRTTLREAASVIVNPESGIVSVRASARQHEKVREFMDRVLAAAKRQVLIEATIAEVSLSDNYQQGIDWSRLRLDKLGLSIVQSATGNISSPASALMQLTYTNPDSRIGDITATVRLLEAFGNVKVLSSPKLSVLNNQTAVLKVVDNLVYFTIKADVTPGNVNAAPVIAYTSTLNSVPVGLVMNITPQIDDSDTVLLNMRPSISRKFGEVIDPNPALKNVNVVNAIPVIRTREMESMLRIKNGNIAVMGGLMEDSLDNTDNTVPVVSRLPLLGTLFQHRDDTRRRTELVVFLRPIVIKDASLDGDFSTYRKHLPGRDFFDHTPGPARKTLDLSANAT